MLILLLVLGLASTASAALNIWDDFESGYPDGGGGWSGPWTGSTSFALVQETGNKYLSNAFAGTKAINRNLSYSEDIYSVQMDFRLGSDQSLWGTSTPTEFLVREASGAGPVHIKFEPVSEQIRVGNVWLTQYGDGALPSELVSPYGNWVTIRVDVDELAGTIELYWEATDGSMVSQGMGAIQAGSAGIDQADVKFQTRTGGVGKEFELDNISITPEPATIMMLGLGGLALIRRKR